MGTVTISARLHAILAREADKAVVFRRGPSNKTAVLEWDLDTDTFTLGQWFYGSFYPYRCDLSPDGRHLVYFAAKYGRTGSLDAYITSRVEAEVGPLPCDDVSWLRLLAHFDRNRKCRARIASDALTKHEKERQIRSDEYHDCSWTAISHVPYLKALALWFNGTGWNGGGLFVDNERIVVNHLSDDEVKRGGGPFVEVPPPEFCKELGHARGECPMVYLPRLARDGWAEISLSPQIDWFEKPLPNGLWLRKAFHYGSSGIGHGCYWESHAICGPGRKAVVDGPNWSWADFDRQRIRIVFAQDGVMYDIQCADIQAVPRKLYDFNGMKYERIKAQY